MLFINGFHAVLNTRPSRPPKGRGGISRVLATTTLCRLTSNHMVIPETTVVVRRANVRIIYRAYSDIYLSSENIMNIK